MSDLFRNPIKTGKVRKDTFWCKYDTGMIVIEDRIRLAKERYQFYSIREAIKLFVKKHPAK